MICRLASVLALIAGLLAVGASAQPSVKSLAERLRQTPPSTQSFHEIGFRRALKAPLVTAGKYSWFGGIEFERLVTTPYSERATVSNGELTVTRGAGAARRVALDRVPSLQVLFLALSSLLSGDSDELLRLFEVHLVGRSDWRMRLVPRDVHLRSHVPSLILLGDGRAVTCAYFDGTGSQTLTLLGDRAMPRADAPFAALVERYCPSP